MLTVEIACRGALREDYLRRACDEYAKRLGAYCKYSEYEAKNDDALNAHIKASRAYKIALCVEGAQVSSEELAHRLDSLVNIGGHSSFIFVIGAAEGLTEETKQLCNWKLSFSKMTFPHQLMRVFLVEQIYRAFNINAGGNYHK